jgi:integrase
MTLDVNVPAGTKIEPGLRRTAKGWQVYANVRGKFVSKHFPPGTSLEAVRDGLKTLRAMAHLGFASPKAAGQTTLAEDVREYLKAKAGMPSIQVRTKHMQDWVERLGKTRDRATVTSLEIRQHLEVWRVTNRPGWARPIREGTVNRRRTALMDFYTVMNGRSGANPVRDIPRYHEEELPLVLPSREDALRAIDSMWTGCLTQARMRVMLWTGWPNAVLKRLRPVDVQWRTASVTVHGRKKGGGTRPKTLPLCPQAVEALRAFAAVKAWGPFSSGSIRKQWHAACVRVGMPTCRPYDLRHLFVTTIVNCSKDERGASELAMHSSPIQTRRYSRAAASTRATAALQAAFG